MDSLQDYSSNQQPTLQDFQPDPHQVAPVYNAASATANAAKTAAISSDPSQVVANYQAVKQQTSISGQSQAQDNLMQAAASTHQQANKQALMGIIGDPNVPDEVKQAAISKVYDQKSDLYSLNKMVAVSALNAPVKSETQEEENVRVDTAGALNEVDGVRQQQQAALNQELAKINPSTTSSVVDFFKDLLPFSQREAIAAQRAEVLGGDSIWNHIKSWVAQGSAKQDISDAINNASPQERMGMVHKLIDIVNTHNGITQSDDNQLNQAQFLQQYLTEGGYGDNDKLADNVTGILDFAVLGGAAKEGLQGSRAAKAAAAAEDAMDAYAKSMGEKVRTWQSNAARDNVRGTAQPSTLSQIYKDTNVDRYRGTFDVAANSGSDEAAQATHGVSRQDAVVNDLSPEVGHSDGSVSAKPSAPDANDIMRNAPDPELTEFLNHDSGNKYFQQEKAQARANVVYDFQQAYGMTARGEMFQIYNLDADPQGNTLNIKAVYGPQVSGYSNAQDALDTAKFALRKYGITDDQVSLISRNGSEYLPATQEDIAAGKGDFLVQVNYSHSLNNGDVIDWIRPTIKYNRLDAASGSGQRGTITSNFLDQASIQDPVVFNGASNASYKEAGLEKLYLKHASEYADMRKALGTRGDIVDKAIVDGNDRGKTWTRTDLQGMGMDDDQIATYQKHRYIQDQFWHGDNLTFGKYLRSNGWSIFKDATNGSELPARAVSKGSLKLSDRLYDPLNNTHVPATKYDLETLYKNGGTVAELRRPLRLDTGEMATHIISKENAADGYLAGIQPGVTQVLAYRPGYYKVAYKDPHFIDKVIKNGNGEVIGHQTVATAGTRQEAELAMRRFKAADGGDYRRRYGREISIDRRSDAHFDENISQGRSTFRFRGKRLEDTTTNAPQGIAHQNIKNHVEVMVDQARSISHYLTLGNAIETMTARHMAVYGEYMPGYKSGNPTFPSNAKDIKYYGNGTEDRKMLGDAKTSANFINYLKHGYVNSLSSGYKAMMWNMADAMGAKSMVAEKVAQSMARGKGPIGSVRAGVFNTMIALNPLRHFALQAHQATMLAAMNPKWAITGKGVNQILYMISRQVGVDIDKMPKSMADYFKFSTGMDETELRSIGKEFDRTGLSASIDKHGLISGALQDMADQLTAASNRTSIASQVGHIPGAVVHAMRKVGFDSGEYINRVSAWLAARDHFQSRGFSPADPEVADQITAKASNWTGNMSGVANQPYNDTEMGVIMQFQQYMHKMFLTGLTNRNLTPMEKVRWNAFYYSMYGLGGLIGFPIISYLDNKGIKLANGVKDAIVDGFESTFLNKTLSMAYDKDIHIDWSAISPYDMYGTMQLIHGLFTTNAGEVVAGTPVGQLAGGGDSKLGRAVKAAARYFHLIDDHEDPVKFSQVAMDFANVSGGFSNLYKAAYLMEYKKKIYATGRTTDAGDVPSFVAVAQAFGMGDKDDKTLSEMHDMYTFSKDLQERDMRHYFTELNNQLAQEGVTPEQTAYTVRMMSEFNRGYQMDATKYALLDQMLRSQLMQGKGTLYQSVLQQADIRDIGTLKAQVDALSSNLMPDEQKASIKQNLDSIQQWKDVQEQQRKNK